MLDKIKENKKLFIYIGGVIVIIFVLILVAILINKMTGGSRSYQKGEDKLKSAAIEYYKEHDNLLPINEGDESAVTDTELTTGKFMSELSKYVPKDTTCTGQVVVRKNISGYSYTPYLDCGEDYYSVELFKYIVDPSNLVTAGEGIYQINGEYVYRGEKVNNYISLGNDNLWRIVKVTKDNKLVLIKDSLGEKKRWDDRYNEEKGYNVGINNYLVSRIRDDLDALYKTDFISQDIKTKLVAHNVCIGKREVNANINDGSIECSAVLENQMISLLNTSDYINASIDVNCTSPMNEACQNYNYLVNEENNWWTITGNAANTYDVYAINEYGEIEISRASSLATLRPVIYLDSSVMKSTGDGSSNNPYTIK